MVEKGDHVIFVDEFGKEHDALVTCVFSPDPRCSDPEYAKSVGMSKPIPAEEILGATCLNLVYVAEDDKQDPYGNQIARSSSVVHKSRQTAHGMFWIEA